MGVATVAFKLVRHVLIRFTYKSATLTLVELSESRSSESELET